MGFRLTASELASSTQPLSWTRPRAPCVCSALALFPVNALRLVSAKSAQSKSPLSEQQASPFSSY